MASEAPPFWWQDPDWRSLLLAPAGLAWGQVAAARYRWARPVTVEAPVINIATLAVGASGRTMAAAALARAALATGRRPGLVLRAVSGAPHIVDADHDLPKHVGDAALRLAPVAPTVVSTDRLAGARHLLAEGCDLIVIADGKVGDQLSADVTIAVVDAVRGLGNGRVAPAGPVRAPLTAQLARIDALMRFGQGDGGDRAVRLASRAARPVYDVQLAAAATANLADADMLFFAGVGDPGRFQNAAETLGARIVERRLFADGHTYAEDEIDDLAQLAAKRGLGFLTTPPDRLRLLHSGQAGAAMAEEVATIDTSIQFETEATPAAILSAAHSAWMRRSGL